MEVVEYLNQVENRKSFILFVRELIKDRENARKEEIANQEINKYTNASEWQNQTIDHF